MVYQETCRFPLCINGYTRMISYWSKLLKTMKAKLYLFHIIFRSCKIKGEMSQTLGLQVLKFLRYVWFFKDLV